MALGPLSSIISSLRILRFWGTFFLPNDFVKSVILHAGDKIDTLGGPSAKQGIVVIASVIDHDGPGIEMKLTSTLTSETFPSVMIAKEGR